jgi:DNA repair exonuclease SbcCD ATPase subunit
MLLLESLTLEGFGPFNEKTVISFPPNGAILIRGQMVNEAISSGTGKSHIMKGVAYVLGYCDVPATELKGWDSKKFSAVLALRDTTTGDTYSVSRSPSLSVSVNGVAVTGTATASEQKLQEILKLPKELRSALTYRAQREKGAFLNNTDSQNKEFFTTLLGLDKLEMVADSLDKENKAKDSVILTNKTKIESLTNTLPLLRVDEQAIVMAEDNINDAKKKINDLQLEESELQIKITQLNAEIVSIELGVDKLNTDINGLQAEKAELLNQIDSNNITTQKTALQVEKNGFFTTQSALLAEKGVHNKNILNLQARKVAINQQLVVVENQKKDLIRIKDDAAKLNEEIKKMEGEVATCPTCSQPWEHARTHLETKKTQLQSLGMKFKTTSDFVTANENLGEQIPDIEKEMVQLSVLAQECVDKADAQNVFINQITAKIMALDNESRDLMAPIAAKDQLIDATRQQIEGVKRQVNTVRQQIGSVQQQISSNNQQVTGQHNLITQYKKMITDQFGKQVTYDAKLVELDGLRDNERLLVEEKKVLELSSKILSREGFLSVIFDEVLADVEARSNNMIARIPNISSFTISIITSSLNKSGKTEKKIKILIYKNGREVSLKNLSGGQLCALELCTDFAVRECIRLRSGSPFGWVCLDEAMDGLDVETKKPALEMLTEMVTGQLLIIDHSTEIKEGFESIITVEYDGKFSRIL